MNDINFTPFPNFTTQRLSLRQLTYDDENELFNLRSDDRVNKFLVRAPCTSVEDAKKFITNIYNFISKNESILWAITLKSNDKLIGTICIWNILKEHFRAEVGFELHPDYQRKGLMQEALKVIIDYGFKNMKLHSLAGTVSPGNNGSIKLMERNNFVKEAYFKEDYYYNGKFIDTAIYSLLNPFSMNNE